MHLSIKNMVCARCVSTVEEILGKLKIEFKTVELGEVILSNIITENHKKLLAEFLKVKGFELLDDSKTKIISKIKSLIIAEIHHHKNGKGKAVNFSDYLSSNLTKDYSTLSRLFSEVEGITIEQYIIKQKIERVKELLIYDELTLSEIAIDMNYSSVSHLSLQFKKVIGQNPTEFKNLHKRVRKSLDSI